MKEAITGCWKPGTILRWKQVITCRTVWPRMRWEGPPEGPKWAGAPEGFWEPVQWGGLFPSGGWFASTLLIFFPCQPPLPLAPASCSLSPSLNRESLDKSHRHWMKMICAYPVTQQIPLLGLFPEDTPPTAWKPLCVIGLLICNVTYYLFVALFVIIKYWKQPKCT